MFCFDYPKSARMLAALSGKCSLSQPGSAEGSSEEDSILTCDNIVLEDRGRCKLLLRGTGSGVEPLKNKQALLSGAGRSRQAALRALRSGGRITVPLPPFTWPSSTHKQMPPPGSPYRCGRGVTTLAVIAKCGVGEFFRQVPSTLESDKDCLKS